MAKAKKKTEYTEQVHRIAVFCKDLRENIGVTLQQLSGMCGVPVASLSAFEHGRANNIEYILYYYQIMRTDYERNEYVHMLFHCSDDKFGINYFKDSEGNVSFNTHNQNVVMMDYQNPAVKSFVDSLLKDASEKGINLNISEIKDV